MDGRDELIRLRGEEIDRLNAELRELAKHADRLNGRLVALDDERNAAVLKLDRRSNLLRRAFRWSETMGYEDSETFEEIRKELGP